VEPRAGKTAGLPGLREAARRDVFAAIDLGSSSGKLLVLARTAGGWQTLVDRKIGCALGKDVENGQPIPPANQDRAIAALREFVAIAKDHGVVVDDIPMITTAVVRNADNGAAFVQRVAAEVGLHPRILSGDEEADVGYRGAVGALLQQPGRYASLDLGGGSFQLAVGTEQGLEQGASTQVGSNHIVDTVIDPRADAAGHVDAALFAAIDADLQQHAPMPMATAVLAGRTLVATGGVSKFLKIQLGSEAVSRQGLDDFRRQMGALSVDDRAAFIQQHKTPQQLEALGIGTPQGALDYAKKLPASLSLLLHILDGIGVDGVAVSSSDARHALIFQAAG
jgi:exopolyphosphatase/pppGpp-phosphohydrolase